jgi:hypothetical protein
MMRTSLYSVAAALLVSAAPAAYASDCDGGCGGGCASGHCEKHCHCMTGEYCPDCGCPCDHHCHEPFLPTVFGDGHAQKLVEDLLHGQDCCVRGKAACKLGCRVHADFCKSPEIVTALIQALFCDTCWEVRRKAALALGFQFASLPEVVAALYIAQRLDHHVMVRDGAAMALDMVTVCRYDCFKDVYKAADKIIPRIRKDYDPTNCKCVPELVAFCSQCHSGMPAPTMAPPGEAKGERIPAPKEEEKGEKIPAPKEEKN